MNTPHVSLWSGITVLILFTRTIISAGTKIFFPFLPIIAEGINLSEVDLSRLLGFNGITSVFAPIFGTTADQRGYQRIIKLTLLLTGIGSLLIYAVPNLWGFAIGLFLMGIGIGGLNPVLAAYFSHLLPFERRSRGLGIFEYPWALASIIVLPLFGLLIGATSWREPFLVMGLINLGLIFLFSYLPEVVNTTNERIPLRQQVSAFFDLGQNWRSSVAVLIADSCIKFGGIIVSVTFGVWLVQEYQISAVILGQVAFVLGFADIAGSGFVSLIGDRLGKRHTVMLASGLGMLFYGLLPIWNFELWSALIGLFLARWAFELGIVANLVLTSEQFPAQRGKMISLRIGLGFIAVFIASWIGPYLYLDYGVLGFAIPGALMMGLAFLTIAFFTVERG